MDSTIEAKIAVWIKKFIVELGMDPNIVDPIELYCDNSGVVTQARNLQSYKQCKHIFRQFYLIKEIV